MYHPRRLCLGLWLLASFLQTQGASKYYDGEDKPYEFGFNIDGMQHRHEKKDENGLINGEFGFITADGVYHVTVYATDENGNFKILSMKNIRVHPYPTKGKKEGHSLKLPPQDENHPPPPPPSTQSHPVAPVKLEPPAKSCSHCSIPTTSTVAPQHNDISLEQQPPFVNNPHSPSNHPQFPGNNPQYPSNNPQYPSNNPQYTSNNPNPENNAQYPGNNPQYPENNPQYPSNNPQYPGNSPQYPQNNDQYQGQQNPQENDIPRNQNDNSQKQQRNPKQYEDNNFPESGFPSRNGFSEDQDNPNQKPVLISAQMQIVDRNTDVNHLNPNERPGLPNGLHKGDMETLLYTFNYTVGFHGHHEEGYRNGAKKGYYFITGRNGIKTRVDYVADETGFHPKISQEVLDVLSDEVPKPETEKDEKFGLKGYEFKWFYYPENSKK